CGKTQKNPYADSPFPRVGYSAGNDGIFHREPSCGRKSRHRNVKHQGEQGTTPMRKPTLKDVARIAGVSVSTVSTALSHPEKLRKETLERITEVIKELGYIRNGAAQALVSRKTNTVAVAVP